MFSVTAYLSSQPKKELYTPLKVNPNLRGYNYDNAELVFGDFIESGKGVSITALAIIHCPTGRDFYFDKRNSYNTLWWPRVLGVLVDKLLGPLFNESINWLENKFEDEQPFTNGEVKNHIQERASDILDDIIADWKCTWKGYKKKDIEAIAELIAPGKGSLLLENSRKAVLELVDEEIEDLLNQIDYHKQTYGNEWIAYFRESFQLRIEVNLDETENKRAIANKLGLNSGITPDFIQSITLIGDLKASKDEVYYDTVMAGYAIFLEAILKKRVNTAAIFVVNLDSDTGKFLDKKVRLISINDNLRKGWRSQRDWALSIANSPVVPNLPNDVSRCTTCKYQAHCWINGKIGSPNLDVT